MLRVKRGGVPRGPRSGQNVLGLQRRWAFTLVEALIAIGAVALVAAGMAAIFATVGDTVSAGRRISVVNAYSAVIERTLRRDISTMTRDGFLVIRNELAMDGERIVIGPDQPNETGRQRRIDELMFFRAGEFVSAREPMLPGITARANTARIYYGHGWRQQPTPFQASDWVYGDPAVWDTSDPATLPDPAGAGAVSAGQLVGLGAGADNPINPNAFAGDWSLLRHVTLLTQPETRTNEELLDLAGTLGATQDMVRDSDFQISLQPAADSVFRSLNQLRRDADTPSLRDALGTNSPGSGDLQTSGNGFMPTFESGIIDIATTDLAQIRSVVESSFFKKSGQGSSVTAPISLVSPSRVNSGDPGRFNLDLSSQNGIDAARLRFDLYRTSVSTAQNGCADLQDLVDLQHAWMLDALPAPSAEAQWLIPSGENSGGFDNPFSDPDGSVDERRADFLTRHLGNYSEAGEDYGTRTSLTRRRMRGEPDPPAYFTTLSDGDSLAASIRRADKKMLTSSVFLPRCTEFIVEWSFGELDFDTTVDFDDSTGQSADPFQGNHPQPLFSGVNQTSDVEFLLPSGNIVWYGLERYENPRVDTQDLKLLARPLDNREGWVPPDVQVPTDGDYARNTPAPYLDRRARLIHGRLFSPEATGSDQADDVDQWGFDRNVFDLSLASVGYSGNRRPQDTGVAGGNNRLPSAWDPELHPGAFSLTSFFGFKDPRFVGDVDGDGDIDLADAVEQGLDRDGNGVASLGDLGFDMTGDGIPDSEWPWPKLLRITMSFADPEGRGIEDTIQIIVEVPGGES